MQFLFIKVSAVIQIIQLCQLLAADMECVEFFFMFSGKFLFGFFEIGFVPLIIDGFGGRIPRTGLFNIVQLTKPVTQV